MAWKIKYYPKEQMVEVNYTDTNSMKDIYEATVSSIKETKETGSKRVLLDFSMSKISLNVLEILKFPDKVFVELKADRAVSVAVVEPESATYRSITRFFVTASTNRGWSVQSFEKREEAEKWLMK